LADVAAQDAEHARGATGARPRHIVDVLLEERAPRLMASSLWPLVRAPLFALLDYRGARRIADAIAPLDGRSALAFARDLLHLNLEIRGLEHVPRSGRCLIAANHPTGIADGVAVSAALEAIRPDHCFFANADALRICPGLIDVVIPIEWVLEKRTIEKTKYALRLAKRALSEERAVVIFPSGAPARRIEGRIQEPPWERSVVTLARQEDAVLIPVNVSGPFSFYYHVFHLVSKELRNLTLFREFLNKAGRPFQLTFGPPIIPSALEGNAKDVARRLRVHVAQTLARNPDQAFD
jgi:putative hemolysin